MDDITYGGEINIESLDKNWSDPNNKWWVGGEDDVEVIDFKIENAEPETEHFSVEDIFANPEKQFAIVTDKKPLSWARTFLDDCFFHADRHTILKWRDEMYIWRRGAWRRASKDQVGKAIYLWGERCFLVGDDGKQKDFNPDIKKVREVISATTAISSIDDEIHQPSLLGPMEINPEMAVAVQNGIVDLRSSTLIPPSPRFFSSSCNKFEFSPDAPEPTNWLNFLNGVWGDDTQSIECMQEIFGYVLTSDTSYQKAFMLIGPKRSGKGTIARVLGELVGHDAMVSPTLASLSTNFGMWPLIGRKLALIADARMSAKTDSAIIAERILSITGEDVQTIDRKQMSMWTGKLVSRFLIMSNILPRFMDASGALTSRMIIIKMTNSFFGKEDPHLFDRLKPELPGIFLWALAGLERLRKRGRFVNPETSIDMVQDLSDMASPMSEFIRSQCQIEDDAEVSRKELYDEWKMWCANNGYREGSMSSFGASLRSVLPNIGDRRAGSDGSRERRYTGIKLRPFNRP